MESTQRKIEELEKKIANLKEHRSVLNFGNVIRNRREELGLTLKDVSKQVKTKKGENSISVNYLGHLEAHTFNPKRKDLVEQIAKVLDIDKDYLLYLCGLADDKIRFISLEDFKKIKDYLLSKKND